MGPNHLCCGQGVASSSNNRTQASKETETGRPRGPWPRGQVSSRMHACLWALAWPDGGRATCKCYTEVNRESGTRQRDRVARLGAGFCSFALHHDGYCMANPDACRSLLFPSLHSPAAASASPLLIYPCLYHQTITMNITALRTTICLQNYCGLPSVC